MSTRGRCGNEASSDRVIVQDTTTRLLNLYELAEIAYPDWFVHAEAPVDRSTEHGPARLLVVEDSAFFRTQLTGMLEGAGYEVVGVRGRSGGLGAAQASRRALRHGDHGH